MRFARVALVALLEDPTPIVNPFLAWHLDGWSPDHPDVGFPPCSSVQDEGDVRVLYLAPAAMASLATAITLSEDAIAWVLDEAGDGRALPWRAVAGLGTDVEVVGLSAHAVPPEAEFPHPLLAAPAAGLYGPGGDQPARRLPRRGDLGGRGSLGPLGAPLRGRLPGGRRR